MGAVKHRSPPGAAAAGRPTAAAAAPAAAAAVGRGGCPPVWQDPLQPGRQPTKGRHCSCHRSGHGGGQPEGRTQQPAGAGRPAAGAALLGAGWAHHCCHRRHVSLRHLCCHGLRCHLSRVQWREHQPHGQAVGRGQGRKAGGWCRCHRGGRCCCICTGRFARGATSGRLVAWLRLLRLLLGLLLARLILWWRGGGRR